MESGNLFWILLQDPEKLLFGGRKILTAQVSCCPVVTLAKSAWSLRRCPLRGDELEENEKNGEAQKIRK